MKRSMILLITALFLLTLFVQPAIAAPDGTVFLVISLSDAPDAAPGDGFCGDSNGDCGLRAGIMEANALLGEDRLVLAGSQPFNIGATLEVTDDLIIDGNTTAFSIIDGQDNQILFVNEAKLTIEDTTLRNGLANGAGFFGVGGAIRTSVNNAELVLTDVYVHGNVAQDYGGAIYALGDVTIRDSIFENNQALEEDGGAISAAHPTADILIVNTIVRNNSAFFGSGGGLVMGGHTRIFNSSIYGNAAGFNGGGIVMGGYSFGTASPSITHSTISGNLAGRDGGGLFVTANPLELNGVTVVNNTADSSENGNGKGGGIYVDWQNGANLALRSSIVAGNINTLGGAPDCWGQWQSKGYNLVGYTGGACDLQDDLTGNKGNATLPALDAKLGVLQINAGNTPTHLPLEDSPAINAGTLGGCRGEGGVNFLTLDQQGVLRHQQGRCDMGSAESPHPTPIAPTAITLTAHSTQTSELGTLRWLLLALLAIATIRLVLSHVSSDGNPQKRIATLPLGNLRAPRAIRGKFSRLLRLFFVRYLSGIPFRATTFQERQHDARTTTNFSRWTTILRAQTPAARLQGVVKTPHHRTRRGCRGANRLDLWRGRDRQDDAKQTLPRYCPE